jgi:hypothetical protein
MAAVLPLGAALAGRVLGAPLLARRRLVPVLAAVGTGYLAVLVVNAAVARPAAPAQANLAERLAARHLTSGLAAGYWLSNIVTVDSHGAVRARNVQVKNGTVARPDDGWETAAQWYDPAQADADFLVTDANPGSATWTTQSRATERAFGRPVRTYRFGEYTVFTWNHNVLRDLPPGRGA